MYFTIKDKSTAHSDCCVISELLRDGFGDHKFYHCLMSDYVTATETTPVGYGLYFFTYSTWEGRTLYIEDIYIDSKHRSNSKYIDTYIIYVHVVTIGKGLATLIMKECTKVWYYVMCK